ncbi:FG-GAP repeat domain-containing protein [Spirochaetota bacterium]
MKKIRNIWDYILLDADPPVTEYTGMAVGVVDSNVPPLIIACGRGAIMWYNAKTYERGIIDRGDYPVALAIEDVDRDGKNEVVAARTDKKGDGKPFEIVWYKPEKDIYGKWIKHVIDPEHGMGGAHDFLFADIDNDGENELIANNPYGHNNGDIWIYKRNKDVQKVWKKHLLYQSKGLQDEGLSFGDLDGDGKLEIVHGPHYFKQPAAGAYSKEWERCHYAHNFREMSRTACIDITGNGRPDIVITESEYPDGRFSWFENRMKEPQEDPWAEHRLLSDINYGHSLQAWKDKKDVHVFIAEMVKGGWAGEYNWNARVMKYMTKDRGKTWDVEHIYKGAGTHESVMCDLDDDGELEVAGKEWGKELHVPKVHIYKKAVKSSLSYSFKHSFIDYEKPCTATDILGADITGSGFDDIVCGRRWYKSPAWEAFDIPGISQVISAYDVDGDGKIELIATKGEALSNELYWIKPVDPEAGKWEEHYIGKGQGDWPHGNAIGKLLTGGKTALVTAYHSANKGKKDYPEIFEAPDDPASSPWKKRTLAEIVYGEELVLHDLTGSGYPDIAAGVHILENKGDGAFAKHTIYGEEFKPARVCVHDINGNGCADIIAGEEELGDPMPFSRLVWFENPGDISKNPWKMHVIDKVRCPHSISVCDIDNDGGAEIICGEHDKNMPKRSRSRLLLYKKADKQARAWYRYVIDDRFEHHDGAKVIRLANGNYGIISHAWGEAGYVHLWEAFTGKMKKLR